MINLDPPIFLATPNSNSPVAATFERKSGEFIFESTKYVEWPEQLQQRSQGRIGVGNRLGVVADLKPRVLWGTEDDKQFTVLDAHMSLGSLTYPDLYPLQYYRARSILRGRHVSSEQTPAQAIRIAFQIQGAGWTVAAPTQLNEGVLSPWNTASGAGLTWTPYEPQTIHELAQVFHELLRGLLQLCLETMLGEVTLEVQLEDNDWYRLDLSFYPPKEPTRGDLLSPGLLTLDTLGAGIELMRKLGPVPLQATQPSTHLQADALFAAASLEGFHRRINTDSGSLKPEFRDLTKAQRKGARKSASSAATEYLGDLVSNDLAETSFRDALGHVFDMSFVDRIRHLALQVVKIAPGLLGPDPEEWVRDLREVRNVQSHSLDNHDHLDEPDISKYYVLGISGKWALKILILSELVGQVEMKQALSDSNAFMYALADMDRERSWGNYSAYEQFSQWLQNQG